MPVLEFWQDHLLLTLLVLAAGWGLHQLLYRFLRRLITGYGFQPDLLSPLYQPSLLLSLSMLQLGLLPVYQLNSRVFEPLKQGVALLCISAVTWVCFRSITLVRQLILHRYNIGDRDNLAARKAHTQFLVMERVLKGLVLLAGLAVGLMTFERVREIGISLLASAGLAGVVLGFAAQKLLGLMLAGVQIALTQPIRLDDAVLIEGEFGWIEEITLTYVVIRLWDLRRQVVPTTWFMEKPFQNWTRASSHLLGVVFLYVDYTLPLAPLRQQLEKVVKDHALWNGQTCVLQVTEALPDTMQLRILVSADDAPTTWDLRVDVREKLLSWIQDKYPQCLPRQRLELQGLPGTTEEQAAVQPGPVSRAQSKVQASSQSIAQASSPASQPSSSEG